MSMNAAATVKVTSAFVGLPSDCGCVLAGAFYIGAMTT